MFAPMADHSEKITELTEITQAGVQSVGVDGLNASVDAKRAERSLRELKLQDEASRATGLVRPLTFRINLRGAW